MLFRSQRAGDPGNPCVRQSTAQSLHRRRNHDHIAQRRETNDGNVRVGYGGISHGYQARLARGGIVGRTQARQQTKDGGHLGRTSVRQEDEAEQKGSSESSVETGLRDKTMKSNFCVEYFRQPPLCLAARRCPYLPLGDGLQLPESWLSLHLGEDAQSLMPQVCPMCG